MRNIIGKNTGGINQNMPPDVFFDLQLQGNCGRNMDFNFLYSTFCHLTLVINNCLLYKKL